MLSLIGAGAGSFLVQRVDPGFLKRIIPVLLMIVAVYTLLQPRLGETDLRPRVGRLWFDVTFGLSIGFYDGFFGPGTGTFWAMAFMIGLGFSMTRATGYTKVMNFASNLSSLGFFLAGRSVHLGFGLVMGLGQLIGARLGSRMVILRGTKFIRPIFISVVCVITLKLLYDAYFPG